MGGMSGKKIARPNARRMCATNTARIGADAALGAELLLACGSVCRPTQCA